MFYALHLFGSFVINWFFTKILVQIFLIKCFKQTVYYL